MVYCNLPAGAATAIDGKCRPNACRAPDWGGYHRIAPLRPIRPAGTVPAGHCPPPVIASGYRGRRRTVQSGRKELECWKRGTFGQLPDAIGAAGNGSVADGRMVVSYGRPPVRPSPQTGSQVGQAGVQLLQVAPRCHHFQPPRQPVNVTAATRKNTETRASLFMIIFSAQATCNNQGNCGSHKSTTPIVMCKRNRCFFSAFCFPYVNTPCKKDATFY